MATFMDSVIYPTGKASVVAAAVTVASPKSDRLDNGGITGNVVSVAAGLTGGACGTRWVGSKSDRLDKADLICQTGFTPGEIRRAV